MGLSLKLLIVSGPYLVEGDNDPPPHAANAFTMLDFDSTTSFHRELQRRLRSVSRPDISLHSYVGDTHRFSETTEDGYGVILRYVSAREFAEAVESIPPDRLVLNSHSRAALAYVKALPPENLIALYWS